MWKLTPKPFNYSVRGFSDQPLSAQCWRTAWHHHQRAPSSHAAGKGWNAWTSTSTGRAHQAFLVTSVLHWVFSSSSTQAHSLNDPAYFPTLLLMGVSDAGISLGWWRKERSEMPAAITDHQFHCPCFSTAQCTYRHINTACHRNCTKTKLGAPAVA